MKTSVHLFLTDILPEKRRILNKVVKNRIFGNTPARKVFSEMKKSGIEGIEVLLPNFVTPTDIEDLKKSAQENKMKIYSVHQALRFLTKTRISEIKSLFESARLLGAKVIVLHMSSVGKQLFDTKYIDSLHLLEEEYKIKIGFENQEKHVVSALSAYCWDSKKFASLMEEKNFNITLDVCHLGQSNGDIIDFFKNNKDRIVNIHLSDYKKHYLNNSLRPMRYKHMPLGKGTLPIDEFLKTLKSEKYDGLLTMEIETDLDGLLKSADIINNA